MSTKDRKKEEQETVAEIVEEEEEEKDEEEELEKSREEHVKEIEQLIDELNAIEQKGGPDIRICPKCFSTRVKEKDVLTGMGIVSSYPVCICLDCGWRSNKWLYLDRTLSKKEREEFLHEIIEEKKEH